MVPRVLPVDIQEEGNHMSQILPFVSVIIPVYNGEEFLRDAVHSIQQQSYQPIEIIIIDDGSTDGTADIAKSFGSEVRYVYQPNKGLPGARNKGLSEASGDLIASLDADDIWTENKLNIQVALFSQDPSIEIVLGRTQKMRLVSDRDEPMRFEPWSEPAVALSLGAALIKKSVFAKVGVFGEEHQYCPDWDWFMRARELGVRMGIHQDTVQYYRRHNSNITENIEEGNHDTLLMLKKSLKRRRQDNSDAPKSLPSISQFEFSPTSQNLSTLNRGNCN